MQLTCLLRAEYVVIYFSKKPKSLAYWSDDQSPRPSIGTKVILNWSRRVNGPSLHKKSDLVVLLGANHHSLALSKRSFATLGELTTTTGLDPNHSMQRAPYLRAREVNVSSGFLFKVKKVNMFPRTGSGCGPLGYRSLFRRFPPKVNPIMDMMIIETKDK